MLRPPEVPDRCPFTIESRPISPPRCVAVTPCAATSLRMAVSAAYNVEKKQGRPLTDDEYIAVLSREVKTRRESVEAFRGGGREDLAPKEEAEIAVLRDYLPAGPHRRRDRGARRRGGRRHRCLIGPRHGQGHGLALPADARPRRRQACQRARGADPRAGRPRDPRRERALSPPPAMTATMLTPRRRRRPASRAVTRGDCSWPPASSSSP